jgi:hypothetical protein
MEAEILKEVSEIARANKVDDARDWECQLNCVTAKSWRTEFI